MKKRYSNFEEIKKDVDKNIKVHWNKDVFFVKKTFKTSLSFYSYAKW